ncbi:MAG TPA: hypothetical protein VNK95_11960 [Caldilineaceae bacterium]|nr:hypothetical protein [Caldilineaceae bacterium]
MKFAAGYGILVGLLMIGQWLFFLATGQVPELQSEPWQIYCHLAAEFVTAAGLIFSGVALLRGLVWARATYLVAAGMLLYSVIASPGYFAQQGQWTMVAMFAGLLVLALVSIVQVKSLVSSSDRKGN